MNKIIEDLKVDFLIVGADRAITNAVKWSKTGPDEVKSVVSDLTYWTNTGDLINVLNLVNALLIKNECIQALEAKCDREESGR